MRDDQESVRTLYKKLLGLYPSAFREQLGESMEQTFTDLCHERKRRTERGWFGFVLWIFVDTAIGIARERSLSLRGGANVRPSTMTMQKWGGIASFLLAVTFFVAPLIYFMS